MLVLSSPSGAGKTTLARRLLEADAAIALSVSLTTRAPRPGEVDGRDYHFVSRAELEARRDQGDLLEWAEVHGNLYGTPRSRVEADLTAGRDVLFDIDWQGARQLAAASPADVVRIFILPPSGRALAERLRRRAQDPPEVVARRLAGAPREIAHWSDYDYVIVNDDVERSVSGLVAIVAAERLRRTRQTGLGLLADGIIAELRQL